MVESRQTGSSGDDVVLVVVCGWAGSQERHLEKYKSLVETVIANVSKARRSSRLSWKNIGRQTVLDGSPKVVTICGSLPVEYIFSPLEWPRRTWTRDTILKEMERHVIANDAGGVQTKIILYAFSNGGGFVVEQLYKILLEQDTLGLKERIKGLIFDSAPGYDRGGRMGKRVLQEVMGTTHWYSRFGIEIVHSCQRALARMLSPERQDVYWSIMRDINWCPILYVYSEDDHLCDPDMLYALIMEKIKRGHKVKQVCWEESQHCGHYVKHTNAYRNAVEDFFSMRGVLDVFEEEHAGVSKL